MMPVDSSKHKYEEVDIPGGKLRLTQIKNGWSGGPAVRIQVRDKTGHLRFGPEVPLENVGDFVGAIVKGVLSLTS